MTLSRSAMPPLDCGHVVRALWDYLDRALDEAQMAAIDAHLAECERCRAHTGFERRLVEELRTLRQQHDDPATLRSQVLDTIRRARAEER